MRFRGQVVIGVGIALGACGGRSILDGAAGESGGSHTAEPAAGNGAGNSSGALSAEMAGAATAAGFGAATPSMSGGAGGNGGGSDATPACDGELSGDVFDPGRVYLAGTLEEGACYRDAMTYWACPNVAATGFDCEFDNERAQISNAGRLVYVHESDEVVRQFACDNCPYTDASPYAYPQETLSNDPTLSSACPANTLASFQLEPEGDMMYRCGSEPWRELHGGRTYKETGTADQLLHLGYGGLALTPTKVLNLDTGEALDLSLPAPESWLAVRAKQPSSFLIAVTAGENVELWEVGMSEPSKLGVFPALPQSVHKTGVGNIFFNHGSLEASGALLTMAEGPKVFEDVIVRRTIDGASSVVYDEATMPLVKIHISALVTGP